MVVERVETGGGAWAFARATPPTAARNCLVYILLSGMRM